MALSTLLLFPGFTFAKQKAQVTEGGTGGYVFAAPNMDSQVIAELPPGAIFEVSDKIYGGFYKIRLPRGIIGYITADDVRIVTGKNAQPAPNPNATPQPPQQPANNPNPPQQPSQPDPSDQVQTAKKPPAPAWKERVPFMYSRYRGLAFEYVDFTEDTMSKTRHQGLWFYGLRWSGDNTLFAGEIYTEAEILYHSGAPSYYQTITNVPTDGFIFLGNFTFDSFDPVGKTMGVYYGFGPNVRYSHFDVGVVNYNTFTGQDFTLDDLTLGALFHGGVAVRYKRFDARFDIKYIMETKRYLGLGLALQMDY